MCPANERWCYIVTSNVTPSLIGWAHTQNVPCIPFRLTLAGIWWIDGLPSGTIISLNAGLTVDTLGVVLTILADATAIVISMHIQTLPVTSYLLIVDTFVAVAMTVTSWKYQRCFSKLANTNLLLQKEVRVGIISMRPSEAYMLQ